MRRPPLIRPLLLMQSQLILIRMPPLKGKSPPPQRLLMRQLVLRCLLRMPRRLVLRMPQRLLLV